MDNFIIDAAATTKTCTACFEHRPREAFCQHIKSADGLDYHCRDCQRAERQINWAQQSLGACRRKDKQRWGEAASDYGEQIDLQRIEDLLEMQNQKCMYCSTVMLYGLGIDRRTHPRAVTVERVDNDVPHTMENCVLACQSCNTKRSASYIYEEFMEHHADIKLNLVKKCQNECQQILPVTSFRKHGGRSHRSACKSCYRRQKAAPY
jgi:5-methylcytosine-specific restriction endonuclease McrA